MALWYGGLLCSPGTQQSDTKRQHLLERLLDAVKQCQIRFGGRKEIASDSDSRVICLCAQFETVLQHGLRKTSGLALTAAALKQVAGFANKTETELTFWFYVKEHLNRHELQRFYALRHISSELGRGRAWLRCALNEHSLERYLHALLADCRRLGSVSIAFYEDWAFLLDEERASMLPTMAAGLNSILFAINIDNSDLNGGAAARGAAGGASSSVSHLLKESTQGIGSLWKESTQGVSSLLREIGTVTTTAAAGVVPGFTPRAGASDPLPVVPRSASADSGLRRERRRRKKVTNIISFDDDLDGGGAGDEEEGGAEDEEAHPRRPPAMRKSHTAPADATAPPPPPPPPTVPQGSVEEEEEEGGGGGGGGGGEGGPPAGARLLPGLLPSRTQRSGRARGGAQLGGRPHSPPPAAPPQIPPPVAAPPHLPDRKSIDDDDEEDEEEEDEVYKPRAPTRGEEQVASDQVLVGSLSSVSTWSPLQVMTERCGSDILIPVTPADPQPVNSVEDAVAFPGRCDSTEPEGICESSRSQLQFTMESSPPAKPAPLSTILPTPGLPEAMTQVELRQAIVALMNRKDELDELNTSLRSLLDGEMEHSAVLRQETDCLRRKLAELEERHTARVQALGRENEVLKVQLKKYVGAVQMLKREGSQANDGVVIPSSWQRLTDFIPLSSVFPR
ncbi:Sorting nexin-29 [Merluccius polli]|uniref:Sorting nexin-29 n=1 Tax=Merluccius polli TaxID=89951 RepID=A0AA47MRK4_MERPO|nr:Sorting nexin-29 [Merluccius polli]